MTDDVGRATPGGSDPVQPPPQPYPPQGYPPQPYPPQPYPPQPYPPQPYPPQGYPPQAYPPQGYPQSHFPPLPYPPEMYPPSAQPPQPQAGPAYPPPPHQPHPHQAGPPQPPGERRFTGLIVGGLAGVLALASVGVGVVALRGSGNGDRHQAAPVAGPAAVTPDASPSSAFSETPAPGLSTPDTTPDTSASESSGAGTPSPTLPGSRIGSSVALSKGDCIQTLPKGQNILTVTLVPCTSPHEAQVGSTFSPTGTAYPGGNALEEIVRSECPARLNRAIRADAPALSWTGYYPEAVEWESGDHSLKCLVTARNGKPLTRSVIG